MHAAPDNHRRGCLVLDRGVCGSPAQEVLVHQLQFCRSLGRRFPRQLRLHPEGLKEGSFAVMCRFLA